MQKTKRKYEKLITLMTVLLILAVILMIFYKPTNEDNIKGIISEVRAKSLG